VTFLPRTGSGAALAQASFPDWAWLSNPRNHQRLLDQLAEHVQFVGIAVLIGFAVAAPLAILAHRHQRLYGPLLGVTGVLFTIPSLAMFMFFAAIYGQFLAFRVAVSGLVVYSLLILFRNTVAGLDSVPKDVREAAAALGHTQRQQLWRVDLPIALPVIVAGVRVAAVTTVGLTTVTALIGWGGLGRTILTGFQRQNLTMVVVGMLASTALAVVVDLLLVAFQRALAPWQRERS
jgi:osmoprotectant transport system permease protein